MQKAIIGLLVLACIFFSSLLSRSQEMLGLTLSDYGGINSATLNPALITGSRYYLDINLITGNSFLENNLYYVPAISNVFSNCFSGQYVLHDGSFKYGRAYNFFDTDDKKSIHARAKLTGPSFMIQVGKHAFGFSTAVRSMQSGNNIPFEIPIIAYNEIRDESFHMIEFDDYDINFTGMAWSEVGLNYAIDVINLYDDKLSIGVGVKALFGMEGAFISASNLNYMIVDRHTVNIINMNADFGFSLPIDEQTNTFSTSPLFRGYGAGSDVGIVYTKKRSSIDYMGEKALCAKPYQDYIFKIGISLLDIGAISFKKYGEIHSFDDVNHYWREFDTLQFLTFKKSLQSYSEVFYADPDSSLVDTDFTIGLPTAASLQFDYNFNNNLYLSLIWIHPVEFFSNTIWRPSQIALVPRYESRLIGFSLPISLYNYEQPRIGFSIRFYSFSIGTDNLYMWIGNKDFTGADIYFSFKFNFLKGKCLSTKKGACFNQSF